MTDEDEDLFEPEEDLEPEAEEDVSPAEAEDAEEVGFVPDAKVEMVELPPPSRYESAAAARRYIKSHYRGHERMRQFKLLAAREVPYVGVPE